MRTIISGVLILILWGAVPALAQLPPEIQVDFYLLRAAQAIDESDPARALVEIDKIILLQKEHELDLSDEFHFRYAQVAAAADLPEQAHEAVVKYLTLAGREGKHYQEALELMNQVQDAIGASKEPLEASNEPVPEPAQVAKQGPIEDQLDADGNPGAQEDKGTLITAGAPTEAQPAPDCGHWPTKYFFRTATLVSVTACLAAGADPMARHKYGDTPLHFAARYNKNPAVIEALLKAGADPMAQDKWNKTTPLHEAAMFNENPAVIKALLAAGGDPMAREDDKDTPLHLAVRFNENPETIKALIDVGIDARAVLKWSALHEAAALNENSAVIEALLKAGADPMAQTKSKHTPLHWAAMFNENPAVTEALLAAGADLMARDKDMETPLHEAAMFNENPAVTEALLAAGADPMARDKDMETPLHEAAMFNENPAVTEALLAAGADLAALDENGHTPLRKAKKWNDNPAVAHVLLAAGAGQVERQVAAAQARRKAKSGPGFLEAVIGIAGGTAIAAAGGGTEEALEAGAVFAGGVIGGTSPQGSAAGVPAATSTGNVGTGTGGGSCEIPGYPSPPGGVANLGFSWCPASVTLQVRSFALQAAGAQCAIATGSSSTPAQVQARRREIAAACGRLAALGVSNCRCPTRLGGPGFSQDSSSIEQEEKRRAQRATQQEEARQAAQRERQARQAEAARQAAEREKRSVEANNAEVLNSNCSCIRIKDNGEYTCLDGFVVGNNSSGKPLCDIRR